jgi:predicted metal-dependent HD superfamily phosphohydrolase
MESGISQEKRVRYFLPLAGAVGSLASGEAIFNDLSLRYSEPHRFYHTLDHITAMLDEFEDVMHFAKDRRTVLLAIWYHDAIYDTQKRSLVASNEEKSAALAEHDLFLANAGRSFAKKVGTFIRASAHNEGVSNSDVQLFLDLDLAILGKDDAIFDAYEKGIRQEYSFVEEVVYRRERSRILRTFLARESIYYTEYFRDIYREKAKENLRRSLQALSV